MTPTPQGHPVRIVERGYQFRFLLLLAFIFAFGAFFLFLAFFVVFSRPLVGDYAGVFYALRHLSSFILPVVSFAVLAYVLLVCGVTVVLCIFALHKVAGPLYRMERVAEGFLAGAPTRAVFFRRGDQAAAMAETFNGFLVALREDRQKMLAAMEQAERLCLQDAATCRAEMERALSRVVSILSRYR
ncbi:MAG: hypothetical protein M1377_01970 [Deltaproteobacteria bacterium]|nr:hypothetical protein [Deltaproteobacteria bacterium]